MELDRRTINEYKEILRQFVEFERERQAFLIAALGNSAPVLQHISWGGSVTTFIPHLLHKLADYGGKQALCAVLEYVHSQVGVNVQQRIDKLLHQLDLPAATVSDMSDTDVIVQRVRDRLHNDIQRLHGKMPLLGVEHWVDLGELFVDVNILEEVSSNSKSELDDLWQDFSAGVKEYSTYSSLDRIGLGKQQQRVSGLTVLEKNTNLMVLGKPGSGKTTYLQRIVTECNEGRLQQHRIPVLIKLRYFVDDGHDFEYNLERYLTQHWRLSDAEAELVLIQGRALILLDGLDEVAGTEVREIAKQIKRFSRTYPQNQLIVTCRTQSHEFRFDYFDYLEVADFNEIQVNTFAEHYFKAACYDTEEAQTKAQQFLDKLYLEENKTIRELAITPILLNLTCSVFHQIGKFYSQRSKLYEEGLELLLKKWDDSREIERDKIYRDLSVERKQELLSYLAVKKFEQPQYVLFEQEEIEGYIAEFLNISRRESRFVLKAVEAQHGLLIERAQKVWSFSHLTFQEYLVALHIQTKCNFDITDNSTLKELIEHIEDKKWRQVILLTSEILSDANYLIQGMKAKIDGLIVSNEKMLSFLKWVFFKSLVVNTDYKLNAVRAFYFQFISPKFVKVFFSTQTIDKLDNRISQDLKSEPSDITTFPARELALDFDLMLALERAYQRIDDIDVNIAHNFSALYPDYHLINALIYVTNEQLKKKLEALEGEISKRDSKQDMLEIHKWWKLNHHTWIQELQNVMAEFRDIGWNWEFDKEDVDLLCLYEYTNKLLIDCLNSRCMISDEVKSKIENALFVPNIIIN